MNRKMLSMITCIGISSLVCAQGAMPSLKAKEVRHDDIMWKKRVTRRLDLRIRQNLSFFARDHEFSKLLIQAVLDGRVTAYKNESLQSTLSKAEFIKRLLIPSVVDGSDDMSDCWDCEEEDTLQEARDFSQYSLETCYGGRDLYLMDLHEDLFFDKRHSRMKWDSKSINLYLSADHPENLRKVDELIVSFDFKELERELFKDNPKAIYFNQYNDAAHLNLSDAFQLRLFHSYIIKVSNPNDEYLVDEYGGDPKTGRMASQWKAYEFLEFEHNLWEL